MEKKIKEIKERIINSVQCKIVDCFSEKETNEEGYPIAGTIDLFDDIIDDVYRLLPIDDYSYTDQQDVRIVCYANDVDHPFLDVAYREDMSSLIRDATYGFLKLRFWSVVNSKSYLPCRLSSCRLSSSEVSSHESLGEVTLSPEDIENSDLVPYEVDCNYYYCDNTDYGFFFRSCRAELNEVKRVLMNYLTKIPDTGFSSSQDHLTFEGMRQSIKFLEGFTAQDSEERGLSYCLRWHEDFGTPDIYQAWSPGCIPARISDGYSEIVLYTAVSLVPNPKYFAREGYSLARVGDSFLKMFYESCCKK